MSDTETIEYLMEEGEGDTLTPPSPPSSPPPSPVGEETRIARRSQPYRRRGSTNRLIYQKACQLSLSMDSLRL